MLSDVRHTKIVEFLNSSGSVKVKDISKFLQVSEKTIREDLEKLEEKGFLKRVHGGAVLIDHSESILPIYKRRSRQFGEKERIAAEACKLIEDGQIILLDAGSTTLELAKLIRHRSLTVITNDTAIASALSDSNDIELCVLGGYRRKSTYTLVGPGALAMMSELNADIAFLGCSGVDLERGLSIFHREEAELKKRMLLSSHTKILLADHTKIGRTALVSFAQLQEIDTLITDSQTDPALLQSIIELGIEVSVASDAKNIHPA
ncbi:DeoR/GlpR family DNA-binding transcription regulator [Paenibacillus piri]|uniref:DeoR/GlpR transcriptional regulator n=1 Tax=Paenibacillus piri TaxID=2547395 RepID=A0A4V6PID1_9BACL|nr:DeoR/GlpR family DNA-binding transcription regulator [Paenibacillus piri]TDF92344.1 DeoR/GlpR transcriptional regulator [Paenibacillus piri]